MQQAVRSRASAQRSPHTRGEAASTSYQPLIALTRTNHRKRSSRTDVPAAYYFPNYGTNTSVPR